MTLEELTVIKVKVIFDRRNFPVYYDSKPFLNEEAVIIYNLCLDKC